MLLGGLWHGASLRFIIWGGLHGAALAFHKFVSSKYELKARWDFLVALLTFHFVCFCWIFFRANDMESIGAMLGQIFHHFNGKILFQFIAGYKIVVILMAVGYILHFIPHRIEALTQEKITQMPLVMKAFCLVAVIVLVMQTKSAGVQPFIYFQF